ncbi:MAG: hypothetical protein WBX25_01760 [Rhodomicrobium sp.]
MAADRFELTIVNSADPYGEAALAQIHIKGHTFWRGAHPIASGAQKVGFLADEAYEVSPLAQGFAVVLNKVAASGYGPWEVRKAQSVFGKAFAPFGLREGINFAEYDLSTCKRTCCSGVHGMPMGVDSIASKTAQRIYRSRSFAPRSLGNKNTSM